MPGIKWTQEHDAIVIRLYPAGGVEACLEAMPFRNYKSITQRACHLGVKLNHHRGGNGRKRQLAPQFMAATRASPTHGGYPWEPLDAMTKAAQEFRAGARAGNLVPIIDARLAA